jgi:hypothetical protein
MGEGDVCSGRRPYWLIQRSHSNIECPFESRIDQTYYPASYKGGRLHLRLHPSAREPADSQDANWDVLACACGEVLGKARKQNGKPGAGTVRLSKWAIALLREDDVDEVVEWVA